MYPDVVAVCPRPESKATFTREPLIVVEVLSASTFKHDLSQKRRAYQSIPSLKAYLIVDQDEAWVEVTAAKRAAGGRRRWKGSTPSSA